MANKHEAEKFLRDGLTPAQIARRMGISVGSVIQYLHTRIGEGALRLSDIYFCLPVEFREGLKQAGKNKHRVPDIEFLQHRGLTREDFEFYRPIRSRSVFAGDLYEHISETELAIHDLVVKTLEQEFGEGEMGYWRRGIPQAIRTKCQKRREEDEEPSDLAFQYTDLIDLYEIMAKNWPQFQNRLPEEYRRDRTLLKKDFVRLNGIRNAVMHPVKRRLWSESDFQFAAKLHAAFQPFRII